MIIHKKVIKKENIGMVAYTEYTRDPRVRRYSEALIRHGYHVDCFVLKESTKPVTEIINGVKIHHLNSSQYRGVSNFSYIISYLRFFFLAFKALTKNISKNYSVIHVHNMPDFLVFTTLINKLFGSKVILDIHDNMPELYKAKFDSKIGVLLYHILLAQERLSCFYADRVVTVHVPHFEYNVKNHNLSPNKTFIIPNFADTNLFHPLIDTNPVKNGAFNVIYHGTIAERFGLNLVLKGIKKVHEDFPFLRLHIYGKGDGVVNLETDIQAMDLENIVVYHGQIELDLIPGKIAESDLGLVTYIQSDATDLMLPLKLMEYMAVGIPALTVINKPIKYYFKTDELAYYESNNLESFTRELLNLIKSPPELSRLQKKTEIVNQRLNWENEQKNYINEIQKLTGIQTLW